MVTLAQQASASDVASVAPVMFYAFGLLTVLSAWAIVLSQNIVRMAIYLLLTLAGVAGMYFMLEAELLAAVQLIVYAGGTLILIVFGVMLTSGNPFARLRTQVWEVVAGTLIAVCITALLLFALVTTTLPAGRAGELMHSHDRIAQFGKGFLSTYLVPFEIAAVLLLVVMIGAAYMARRRAR